jgi:oligoribonuclease NrnB/cAMP/cGMP phosphodiesterase (DHH superfamily)
MPRKLNIGKARSSLSTGLVKRLSSIHKTKKQIKLDNNAVQHRYPLVYYHHMCSDGLAGAWCGWRYFTNKGIEAEYKGIQPDKAFHINIYDHKDRDIYFIDVLGTKELHKLCTMANQVIIIDHHKSNQDFFKTLTKLPRNLTIHFDNSKSACQLAWDYYNPGVDRPWFINYIADRDLWEWKLADSKPINIGLYNLGHLQTMDSINQLYLISGTDLVNTLDTVKKYGVIIEKYHAGLLEKISGSATEVTLIPPGNIGQFKCWISSIHGELASDLGNILATKPLKNGQLPGLGATYTFDFRTGNWNVSLRSVEGGQDVSIIAKQFGGGGHARASAFVIKAPATLKKYFIYNR